MEVSFIRSEWARLANLALKQAEQEASIDHRTLKAQGINREPTIHLGVSASAMERRGIQTVRGSINRRIRERQAAREELAELEREEREEQRQIREQEAAEKLRPQLESWAVVAHGLFAGDARAMFDQTKYPTRQCNGVLNFMRCLNLVDDDKKVQPETIASVLQSGAFWVEDAKMFCLMKDEQEQKDVSFSDIYEMPQRVAAFEAKFRAEQERVQKAREEQEAIEQERQDKQRIQAWKQLANPQYTEDERSVSPVTNVSAITNGRILPGVFPRQRESSLFAWTNWIMQNRLPSGATRKFRAFKRNLRVLGFLDAFFPFQTSRRA